MNLIRMSVFNATKFLLETFTESGYHSLSNLTITVHLVVVFLFVFPLDVHFPDLASIELDLEEF